MGKLSDLRNGIPKHVITNIPGTDMKVALVQVNNRTLIECREKAMEYVQDHTVDSDTFDIIYVTYILEQCMRAPERLEESFTTFDEINENLTTKEIYDIHRIWLGVQDKSNVDIEELTGDEFEEIKKKLSQIPLNDLDGELQTILKYFHQIMILKDLQMVK